jgi:predicted RNA-binding Zn-ribbon protein involved in translation (DUF1610 family)
MDVLLLFLSIMVVGTAAGAYGLKIRDYVRRGQLHRRKERLRAAGVPLALPDGRVPCPECGEAILPHANRCPFCRQVVTDRI